MPLNYKKILECKSSKSSADPEDNKVDVEVQTVATGPNQPQRLKCPMKKLEKEALR